MKTPDFSHVFEDGHEIEAVYGGKPHRYRIKVKTLGDLRLVSGRLVACDPLTSPETGPFGETFPPGSYPVIVSVAHAVPSRDKRVAFAMLKLRDVAASEWKMLAPEGSDISELGDDQMFGYGVDAGTGCFMDQVGATILAADYRADDILGQKLLARLQKSYVNTWSWGNIVLDKKSGANVLAFASGEGDGFYASYVGYGSDGAPVAVVTDFGIFNMDKEQD